MTELFVQHVTPTTRSAAIRPFDVDQHYVPRTPVKRSLAVIDISNDDEEDPRPRKKPFHLGTVGMSKGRSILLETHWSWGKSYSEFSQHSRKQVAIEIRAFLHELCLANHSFVSIQLMQFVD
jgi:hypothetical protein